MKKTYKTIFADNLKVLLNLNGTEREINNRTIEISAKAEKLGQKVSVRTIKNAIEEKHAVGIDKMDAIAAGLGAPLWVMLIPGLDASTIMAMPEIAKAYLNTDDKQREFILQAARNAIR